jgi:hypothetical protein
MKTILCTLLCLFGAVAQAAGAGSTHGTATVIGEGEWELGLYAPLRRGFGDDVELSIHPLTAIRSPNIALKKVWKSDGEWMLATRHSLFYPTPLLKSLSKEGTGGIIVADAVIPPIVASDNRIILSRSLSETTMLSVGGRVMLGVGFGENDWPSIHMPLAYPRTVAYQDYVATALTAQLDGLLFRSVFYRLEFDGWFLPLSESKWATETKGMAHWRPSERFTLQAGGTFVVGAYPYGNSWHLLPGFDLIWRW